jgi:phospholipase/carboxylesterase
VLLRFAVLLSVPFALVACDPATAQRASDDRSTEPLPYLEIRTAGASADAELPLIVALHGRGDRPERFAPLFDDLRVPARIVIPRAPHAWGDGFAWFDFPRARPESGPRIAAELSRHADRVVATADAVRAARPTRGGPLVVGFSQGGMLAYAIAIRRPDRFAAVFPVSGFLFPELLTAPPRALRSTTPPIIALHGASDPLVSIDDDRRGIRLLAEHGVRVTLHEHDAAHTITPAMRAQLFSEIERALAR